MSRRRFSSLWLWVGLGFGLLLTAWTFMLTAASRTSVQTVPLEHKAEGGGR